MEASKQNFALIRGHIQVARMAYRAGEYHAAYRNLNSAIYEIQGSQGQQIDDIDFHELKHLFGKVQVALRMYEPAEASFRNAIDFGRSASTVPPLAVISDTRHLAYCLRLRGCYQEAESLYLSCIETLKEIDTKEENQLAKAYLGLALVYIDAQRLADADKTLAIALAKFESNPGARSFWSGRALVSLARLRLAQGKRSESLEILQQALNILEPLIGPHHPLRLVALRRLADLLDLEGEERTASAIQSELKEVEKYLKDHDT